ncbi:MAG: hypothetical protein NZ602_14305 [Thermoguttaceae bacterium]|nr:hypothetical protein [Thermoguttaceae bacterium]MDW8039621.1 hypothetical protein [Thermoguttaceae bacterium]
MAKRGRPNVLDATKKGQILAIVSLGGSRSMAARFVGCTPQTIRNEAQRDPEFAAALVKAADTPELTYLQSIRKAAQESRYWRAAAWALERTRPHRYAPRRPDTISFAQMRRFISDLVAIVTEEVPARYRKRILQRLMAATGTFQPPSSTQQPIG